MHIDVSMLGSLNATIVWPDTELQCYIYIKRASPLHIPLPHLRSCHTKRHAFILASLNAVCDFLRQMRFVRCSKDRSGQKTQRPKKQPAKYKIMQSQTEPKAMKKPKTQKKSHAMADNWKSAKKMKQPKMIIGTFYNKSAKENVLFFFSFRFLSFARNLGFAVAKIFFYSVFIYIFFFCFVALEVWELELSVLSSHD